MAHPNYGVGLFLFEEKPMIRLFTIEQAQSLRDIIPELALTRSLQFQGEGYVPEEHGHIVVIQEGDEVSSLSEIGNDGLVLFDEEGLPTYEYVEAFMEDGRIVYEVVFQIDDSRTIAVIVPDEPWLDARLREDLQRATQGRKQVKL